MDKEKIFKEIDNHIQNDEKPSLYIKKIFEDEKISKIYPFNMLNDLKYVEQNRKYHPEGDVFSHTLMVVDEAARRKNKSKDHRVLLWAALLHDIGKAPTTRIIKGKITSYNHEKVGSLMAYEFLKEFTNDDKFIKKVCSMVRWHMEALYVIKDLPFSNIKHMLKEVDLEEIALLNLCDRLGRGEMTEEKIEGEIKGIKIFIEKCKEYQKISGNH